MDPIFSTAVLVPFFGCAMIFGIVFVSTYFGSQSRIARYKTMEKLIEKSDGLPPEQFEALKSSLDGGKYKSEYKSGLILSLIGIALVILFALQAVEDGDGYHLMAIGLFPLAVGVAKLLNVRREDRKTHHQSQ